MTKGTLFQCFYSDVRTVKISHLEALVELKTEKNIAEVMDSNLALLIISAQEIIKVRERIPYLGPLTKVIPLELFLDIVPSSSAEITRALRGCFREGFVYMFVFKAKENLQRCWDVFFGILITTKGASALGMFYYISKL